MIKTFFDTPDEVRGDPCLKCGLWENCRSPKMQPSGQGRKGIFILAEAPGFNEDKQGAPLVGASGQRLRRVLEQFGIDLDYDCWKFNAVNCRPTNKEGQNRTPTDKEISHCRPRVLDFLKNHSPKVILALGGSAMKSLLQHRCGWKKGFPTMSQWQGACIPDPIFGAHIISTWHPAYVLRVADGDEGQADFYPIIQRKWESDISLISLALAKERPKKVDFRSFVDVILSPKQAVSKLENFFCELVLGIIENPMVAFDYETTGLKPHAEGHMVYCAGISWAADKAMAFLLTKETWPIFSKILKHPQIGKIAHNAKFEELWTRVRGNPEQGGFPVENWAWDTMLAAHVLDNRTGITGLKFQTYINFGEAGYDDTISPFLEGKEAVVEGEAINSDDSEEKKPKTKKTNANSKNTILEAPVRDVLLYNGLDALFTYKLWEIQQPEIGRSKKLSSAYQLFHDASFALVDAEENGICVDEEYYKKQLLFLERKIEYYYDRILQSEVVKQWKEKMGSSFKLSSNTQLADMLYKTLGAEATVFTNSGAPSVSKSTLENMDHPFVVDLLEMRRLEKLKSTYITAFVRESNGGVLRPFYNLNRVVSYRGSCDSPNFQNIPKRDPEAQKSVRRGLLPRPGFCWLEVDFSGIEVRIAATYHKDPAMISYLSDPTKDMHRDTAADLFLLPIDQITKTLRHAGKNGFVFPQFYGDYFRSCAESIWKDYVLNDVLGKLGNGTHVRRHLATQGIKTLSHFVNHVKEVERKFWEDRFPVYDQWRKDHWQEYLQRGFFYSHTGFRYVAPMNRNAAINYGTQGAAFHCLLWSFIQTSKKLKTEKWDSFLVGQIHDAMDLNAAPQEINVLLPLLRKIMVDDLSKQFDWINVPIDVEFEMAPMNKSWYAVKEITHRKETCDCGLEWGYKEKKESGIWWTCPVCTNLVQGE